MYYQVVFPETLHECIPFQYYSTNSFFLIQEMDQKNYQFFGVSFTERNSTNAFVANLGGY